MLTILLLLTSQIPVVMCRGDRVCVRANEFAGRYREWTAVVNNGKPGTIDVRESQRWKQVERAFNRLRKERSN